MKVNYAKASKTQRKANLKLINETTLTKEKLKKIKNYAARKGLSIKECKQEFKKSKLFRSLFLPEVSRQNVFEKAFFAYLMDTFGIESVVKLQTVGNNALFLDDGRVVSAVQKSDDNRSKSIDFELFVDGTRFLISHKYTENEGGAQDNQYTDVHLFLQEAKSLKEAHTVCIAVVDGDYYKRNGRLQFLQKKYNSKNVKVITSEKLAWLIKSLTKKSKAA